MCAIAPIRGEFDRNLLFSPSTGAGRHGLRCRREVVAVGGVHTGHRRDISRMPNGYRTAITSREFEFNSRIENAGRDWGGPGVMGGVSGGG